MVSGTRDKIGVLIRYPIPGQYLDEGTLTITIEEAIEHLVKNGGILWELPIIFKGVKAKPFPHSQEAKLVFFVKFPERKVTHVGRIYASGRRDRFFAVPGIEKYVHPKCRENWRDERDAFRTYSFLLDRIWKLGEENQPHISHFTLLSAGRPVNSSDQLHRPRPVAIPYAFLSQKDIQL